MFAAVLLFLYICPTLQGILKSEDPTCTGLLGCSNQNLPSLLTLARVLLPPPKSDRELNTTMILWTGANSSIPQVIDITNPSAVNATDFDPKKNTTIISHGYMGDGYLDWVTGLCRALQTKESINCFAINWKKGAGINYLQSVSNIPAVGTQVENFIKYLIAEFGLSFSNFFLIGFSLGAHVVGDIGSKCDSRIRIFGIDPASYGFIGAENKDKLDRSDGIVVVIMHVDMATLTNNVALHGFGSTDRNGHMDIFVNGGRDQPGCPKSPLVLLTNLNDIEGTAGCSHLRAPYYLISAILYSNIGAFTAYRASSVKDFNNGAGFPCNDDCIQVGNFTGLQEMVAKNSTHQLYYFFNTSEDYPYYTYRCKTTLQISANSSTTASLSMTLQKDSNQSKAYDLYSGAIPINSTSKYLDLSLDGPLEAVTIYYIPDTKTPVLITLTVEYGHNSAVYTLHNTEPTQDATIRLDPK